MIITVTEEDEKIDPQALVDQLAVLGYAVREVREKNRYSHYVTLWEVVDDVAVERVINRQRVDQPLNPTERAQVIKIATERGLPLRPIFIAQGWRAGRYRQIEQAA